MNQPLIGTVALLLLVILLVFRRRLFVIPNTPLDWETLATLMRDESAVEKIDITDRRTYPNAEVQMQFRTDKDSVAYFRTTKDGSRAETLDVCRFGSAGFLVTFHDEVPTRFTRIGGIDAHNPQFDESELTVLVGLLRRIRGYADS